MPKLDRVTAPASEFAYSTGVTVIDLAYEEFIAQERDGAPNHHVEMYFLRLGMDYPDRSSFKVVDSVDD